jgi:hypothetical protein
MNRARGSWAAITAAAEFGALVLDGVKRTVSLGGLIK